MRLWVRLVRVDFSLARGGSASDRQVADLVDHEQVVARGGWRPRYGLPRARKRRPPRSEGSAPAADHRGEVSPRRYRRSLTLPAAAAPPVFPSARARARVGGAGLVGPSPTIYSNGWSRRGCPTRTSSCRWLPGSAAR